MGAVSPAVPILESPPPGTPTAHSEWFLCLMGKQGLLQMAWGPSCMKGNGRGRTGGHLTVLALCPAVWPQQPL